MKKSLIFALALMLVLAFATSAMAAQVLNDTTYLSTKTGVYYSKTGSTALQTVYGTPTSGTFKADGVTNYPYEIYIPNELNPGAYRIHSSYAKNTDACASCHSTHTAVGNTLLQWYSTYETCMACHDGTVTTTYNVEVGEYISQSGLKVTAMGGSFAGTDNTATTYASNHNVTGALSISAAPGGSTSGTDTQGGKRWTPMFGCESCHTPHGNGGNARILHPDANYTASRAAQKVDGYYVSVGGTVYTDATQTQKAYIIKGYPYTVEVSTGVKGSIVANAYITNAAGFSQVVIGNTIGEGTAKAVYGTAALQVKMTIGNYLSYQTPSAKETVAHDSGMNAFCGACHTDYNTSDPRAEYFVSTNSSDNLTGEYTKAHRHQVGVAPLYNNTANGNKDNLTAATMVLENGKLECLTCHVAHGVNADFWKKTVGSTGTAYLQDTDLVELAGSSALKRLPNMGTCEACHQKGASAEGYAIPTLGSSAGTQTEFMPNTYNNLVIQSNYAKTDLDWVGSAKCIPCHKEFVDGWTGSGHEQSGHQASSVDPTKNGGCAACHSPSTAFIGKGTFVTGQIDDGITCEACHGAGKLHVAAPSSKNILNPGTKDILRQTIECSRCHDMFANTPNNLDASVNLKAYSGSNTLSKTAQKTTTQMYAYAVAGNWSPAFRYAGDAPNAFANASQNTAQSSHFGGAWGYADSKHYLGTGTASNPNGVVSCTTCHDMHSSNVGGLKFDYNQLCEACHGTSSSLPQAAANLAQSAAMPTNSWGRHQMETIDYAHSFKFGAPSAFTTATLLASNVESNDSSGRTVHVTTLTDRTGDKNLDLFQGPVNDRGGAVGGKVSVFDGATQVFNNYAGTYDVTYVASGLGAAVEGTDYVLEPTGVIEFFNTTATFDTGKLAGTYTITWTSAVNSAITASDSFNITH